MGIIKYLKKIKENLLEIFLATLGLIFCYLASMPKHGDYWTILHWSTIFEQDPLHYMDILLGNSLIQIYPPTYNVIQAAWVQLGSIIFNYDVASITQLAHPDIFPLWGMIPDLVSLFLLVILSYYTLKNKWLSIICFGTLAFVSIIIMGQIDVIYTLFIYVSMLCMIKALNDDKYLIYILLSFISLGISLQFKTFGGLLLPAYVLFAYAILRNKSISTYRTLAVLAMSILLFVVMFLVVWIPYTRWFAPTIMGGESGLLLSFQIGTPLHIISIWLLGYIIILYGIMDDLMKGPAKFCRNNKHFLFYCFAIIAWFFIAVYSHPQWWILLLPVILLVLDNFSDRINYLLVFGLFSLFIFYPMLWVNNVDYTLVQYIPTFRIGGQAVIELSTCIIAILVLLVINLKRELKDGDSDKTASGTSKGDTADHTRMIAPLLITVAPYLICILIGYSMMMLIGITVAGGTPASQPVGEIYDNIYAGQTFISEYNNLNSVGVDLATYGHAPLNNIIFHLKSSPTSTDIRTVKLNGNVTDNTYYNFTFPSIADSKGKKYYFSIEYPEARKDDSISIWYNDIDTYSSGTAYYNNTILPGDLIFKTHYDLRLSDILSFIGNSYPEIPLG